MEIVLSVLLFALVSTVTPGPNNIMIMTSGVNFGVWRTLPHYLGICFGFPAMVVAISLGLGKVFEAFPQLHLVIKVLGITYLLYLAWRIATTATEIDGEKTSKPLSFLQAAAFQWVNPKAWVMAVGALAGQVFLRHIFHFCISILCSRLRRMLFALRQNRNLHRRAKCAAELSQGV